MRYYTVHHTSTEPGEILQSGDTAVFVKEGFSFSALVAQPFWLVYHRLWVAAALYTAVLGLVFALMRALGISIGFGLVFAAIMLLFAFEAGDIRRYFLWTKGQRTVGIATGRTLNDAEARFFTSLEATMRTGALDQPERTSAAAQPAPADAGPVLTGDSEHIIGLFPKPGS